jgi:alpha-soluble NSF attachment protein
MGDYAGRGADLMKRADKKLNSFGLFANFSGSKYDDAAELYEKAANQFKLAKACKWTAFHFLMVSRKFFLE